MTFRKLGSVNYALAIWSVSMLLLLLTAAAPMFAQNAMGTILGVVKDTQGGTVAGAAVTIRNTETGLTRSLTTGEDGAYRAPALPVGGYTLKVEKTGFKSSTHDGLVLNVADEMVVSFTLDVGASAVEVVVTGEAPQVDTTTSTLGGLVDEKRMAELPLNGRNYADLTLLQPGVSKAVNVGDINSGTNGTWVSSNGAPLRSNNITLDGTSLVNQQGANSASPGGNTLGVDGIREYRVVTEMFGAEYGVTMGSQTVMTSKSGTNRWHGDFFEALRNDKLDANVNREIARLHDATTIAARPPHRKNNFGASFGGPIKKDKTFFYAVYEGLREVSSAGGATHVLQNSCYSPNGILYGVAGAQADANGDATHSPCADGGPVANVSIIPAELEPRANGIKNPSDPNYGRDSTYFSPFVSRNGENFGQFRLDQNFSSNDTLFGRYTTTKFAADNDSRYPEYKTRINGYNNFITVGENHVFSANLLNSLRLSFSRTNSFLTNYVNTAAAPSSGIAAWAACPALTCPGYSFANDAAGNPLPFGSWQINYMAPGQFGATGANDQAALQNIYSLSDDVFYSKGRHALKFGILFDRYNQSLDGTGGGNKSVDGEIVFAAQNQLLEGAPQLYDFRGVTNQSATFWTYNTIGLYAQDDIRVTSRLTVNLGLRYEFNTTPNELNGRQYTHLNLLTDPLIGTQHSIMQNDSLKNFSPRIGFAWDITGRGKTAIRGGFGEYYDVGNIGEAIVQYNFAAPPLDSYYVVNPIYPNAPKFQFPLPSPISCSASNAPANCTPANFQVLHTLDYHSKQPHMLQYNLTAQQQLPWNLALQVGYVGTRGINLFRLAELNPFKQVTCTGPNCIAGKPFWGTDPTSPQGRVNPNFGSATEVTTGSSSWYNALEVAITMQNYHGLQMQTAYTFSKNLDTTQGQQYVFDCFSAQGSGQGIDPTNPNGDKGPTCFDAKHNFRMNFLYHFPNLKSNGILSKVTNGWWTGNIISIQSGYPFNVNTVGLISNSGVFAADQGERPNLVTSTNLAAAQMTDPGAVIFNPNTVITGNPDGWFNPHMFTLVGPNATSACNQNIGGAGVGNYGTTPGSLASYNPATGTGTSTFYGDTSGGPAGGPTCYFGYLGNEPRNNLRGARLRTWDLSINKDTKLPFLGENGMLQFRAEMFNLLNHANWGFISNQVFIACAPTNGLSPNLFPYSNGNGNCGGSNEGGTGAQGASNYNAVQPMRQIQFTLRVEF